MRGRRSTRVAGVVLLLTGLGLLGWVGWQYIGTGGSPFRKLLDLRKGDQVVIETATAVYTYELDTSPRDLTVKPTDTWVLDPVPGQRQPATRSTITLTTCQDLFHSQDRSVAFGHLVRTSNKS